MDNRNLLARGKPPQSIGKIEHMHTGSPARPTQFWMGKSTLDAISSIKNQIRIIDEEIVAIGELSGVIPETMSLVLNAKEMLHQELGIVENKVRLFCKEIGVTPETLELLQPYTAMAPEVASQVAPAVAPQVPAAAARPFRWRTDILNSYRTTKTLLEGQGECTARLIFNELAKKFRDVSLVHVETRYNKEKQAELPAAMAMPRTMVRPRDSGSSMPSVLTEITDPALCQQVTMPDSSNSLSKVSQLLYVESGFSVLALASNGVLRLWKWSCSGQNLSGKATASVTPKHWQPETNDVPMTNDVPALVDEAVPCLAVSNNGCFVISACGGEISLFNVRNFEKIEKFMKPPPASTFLAYKPTDDDIIAIGMENLSIIIYNARLDVVKAELKGHKKQITGIAFSKALNILVSSGADAQFFVWGTETWENKYPPVQLVLPAEAPVSDTRVGFHSDGIRLLVSHGTQLVIYDTSSSLQLLHKWEPQGGLNSAITCACYTGNSQRVCASFADGNIAVFDAESLSLRCRIDPSAYMPNSVSIIPHVIAAHPTEVKQFAVGFSDGSVKVMEPLGIS